MPQGKNGGGGGGSSASGSPPPPAPGGPQPPGRSARRRDPYGARSRQSRGQNYYTPRDSYNGKRDSGSRKRAEEHLVLCVYNNSTQGWHTAPLNFDPYRITDQELWLQIRSIYRTDLFKLWRRLLLFTKLKRIVPIEFTRNGTPKRQDPKNYPDSHEFTHCFRHPHKIRTEHEWVDWFVKFNADPNKTYGLEFIEGLWAEKLAAVAIALTIAMVVVSIVWCVKGGQLQTVFTVMGFVLSGLAAEIALIALYYQVTMSS